MYIPFEALLETLVSCGEFGFFLFLVHTCFAIIFGIVLNACRDEFTFRYFSKSISFSAFACLLISFGSVLPLMIHSSIYVRIDIALWFVIIAAISCILAYKLDN